MAEVANERYAPEGKAWICGACAKISPYDKYGDEKSDRGWDESCVMNAVLVDSFEAVRLKEKYHRETAEPGPGCNGV